MREFYRIASLIVEMDTFGQPETFARPYAIGGDHVPDITIESLAELVKERHPEYNDVLCEYLGTGYDFYTKLLNHYGMMLHSSAIAMDGKAYLFSASCGTGKSTHTSLWRRVFGDDHVRILNDDKPALRYEDGTWYAYGTPWSGKTGQNLNLRVPVAGICFLERGISNEIERCSAKEVLPKIFSQTRKTEDPILRGKLLEILDRLIRDVPIWKLKCNMEPEAAIVAYEAMSGQKYEGDWK